MRAPTSYIHVNHLIELLRQAAVDNAVAALRDEQGGLGLCLGAALANDAADALQGFLDQSVANDPGRAGVRGEPAAHRAPAPVAASRLPD